MNVANCPRCGQIFVTGFKDVCPKCVKDIDLQYDKCLKYLRDNKGITINELSDATEVSIKQITKFIREGRISMMNAPNMSYPCEMCGTLIRESHICDSCRTKLIRDVKQTQEDETRRAELKQEQAKSLGYKIRDRLSDR